MALTKVTGQVIKNTTDVTVGVLTVTNTLAVGGTVSIGGTLTYEDVTNVDAVGLITARNGIVVGSGITLSKDGDIFATGVTTATTFVGALTGNVTGNVTGNISGGTVAGSTGTFSGVIKIPDGSTSAPSIAASSDTNSGLYFAGADTVGLVAGGSRKLLANSSGITINNGDLSIDDKIIHTGDTNTAIRFPAADNISFETSGSEGARLDAGRRFLIGSTTARTSGGSAYAHLQVEGTDSPGAEILVIRNSNDTYASTLGLVKTRGTSDGAVTTVADNDKLGQIQFRGADGSDIYSVAASIHGEVDGSPSDGTDMPGALVFGTTADGSASPTERLRITSDGKVGINETAPSESLQIDGDILLGGQSNSGTADYALKFEYNNHQFAKIVGDGRDSTGYGDLDFYTSTGSGVSNLTQRMTIRADGDIGINAASPGSRLTIYDADGDCLLLASHNYSGEARIGFSGNQGTGGTLVNGATCGAIGVTASAPGGAATGYMSVYTNEGDDLEEAVRIAADNTVHVAATGSDDITYSLQTGRAQHSNSQSKQYSITGLAWGQITFKIGVSDGNAKYGHFAVLLGGSMWAGGNGYNATPTVNDASGVNISVNKQDGGYHITIANAGNSNTLYGAWQLEASMYSNLGKPTLTIS